MTITRLTGGLTPADGADPRTFPAIWDGFATDLEAGVYSRVPVGGSAGQVLVKDSGTDYDASFGVPYGLTRLPYLVRPGQYARYPIIYTNPSTNGDTARTYIRVIPFPVPESTGFDRVGVTVDTANASTTRLGLYASGANNEPTTLLNDFGTIDTTTTGFKEITVDVDVSPGLYWLAIVSSISGTAPIFRGSLDVYSNFSISKNSGASVIAGEISGWRQTGNNTSFVDPFPGPVIFDDGRRIPLIAVRWK
jgi:hypothetical protein